MMLAACSLLSLLAVLATSNASQDQAPWWARHTNAVSPKRAALEDDPTFFAVRGKKSSMKPNALFSTIPKRLLGKRFLKPNSLFNSIPKRMDGKRSLKPNSLFGNFGKRSLKPNSLFGNFGKRYLNPNSLFGNFNKRGLKPNSLFGNFGNKRMLGKRSLKPNSLFGAIAGKRGLKPNSLFGGFSKRSPVEEKTVLCDHEERQCFLISHMGVWGLPSGMYGFFKRTEQAEVEEQEEEVAMEELERLEEEYDEDEEEDFDVKRSEAADFWATRGKRSMEPDFWATRGKRGEEVFEEFEALDEPGEGSEMQKETSEEPEV